MSEQLFICTACDKPWSRTAVRGRVPKLCPSCRAIYAEGRLLSDCAWCGRRAWIRRDADCCSRLCGNALRATVTSCPVPQPRTTAPRIMRSPRLAECARCGVTFATHQPSAETCSKRCNRKQGRIRRRVRETGSFGEWRWSDFMRIAAKFGYCCAYCGQKPERLDPDHVIPLAAGGPNTTTNLLPACASCNCDKRDLSLPDWAAHRAVRGLPIVRTSWDSDDARFWHLTHLSLMAA